MKRHQAIIPKVNFIEKRCQIPARPLDLKYYVLLLFYVVLPILWVQVLQTSTALLLLTPWHRSQ